MCNPHVLLVQDNQLAAFLVKSILKKMGVNVTIVQSGAEAIILTHQNQFDAIILDFILQDTTADTIIPMIHKNNPKAQLYGVTGDARQTSLCSMREAGVSDITLKPFKPISIQNIGNRIKDSIPDCGGHKYDNSKRHY